MCFFMDKFGRDKQMTIHLWWLDSNLSQGGHGKAVIMPCNKRRSSIVCAYAQSYLCIYSFNVSKYEYENCVEDWMMSKYMQYICGYPEHATITKHSPSEASKKKGWDEDQKRDNTHSPYETTDTQTKYNCNVAENRLSRKTESTGVQCVCVGGGGGGGVGRGLRQDLFALNSDAAPNYKYIFSVHLGVLFSVCETSQWNTYNQIHCGETFSKGLNGDLKPKHKKPQTGPRWDRPLTTMNGALRLKLGQSSNRVRVLTLSTLYTGPGNYANSVDPDETAHHELSPQDLHCSPSC